MTTTRSPVRLTVLHDGDYCDTRCSYMHEKWGSIGQRCGLFSTSSPLALGFDTGLLRTKACKAETQPRSCAGCMHQNGPEGEYYCNKYDRFLRRNGGIFETLFECDGPEVAK